MRFASLIEKDLLDTQNPVRYTKSCEAWNILKLVLNIPTVKAMVCSYKKKKNEVGTFAVFLSNRPPLPKKKKKNALIFMKFCTIAKSKVLGPKKVNKSKVLNSMEKKTGNFATCHFFGF